MRSVPLKAIQELLGHATIDMTMRYAHLSPEVTRETVNVLDGEGPIAPGRHMVNKKKAPGLPGPR